MKFCSLLLLVLLFFSKYCNASSITIPYDGKIKIQVSAVQPFYVNGVLIVNGCYKFTFCQNIRDYTVFSIDFMENDSLNVVIKRYRGNLYDRMFGVVTENYTLYKKSFDHVLVYNNQELHSAQWCMNAVGTNPSIPKRVLYIQTSLPLVSTRALFNTLNGFFMQNYMDCRLVLDSVTHENQCGSVSFNILPDSANNLANHTNHITRRNSCTVSVKGAYLIYVVILAHEFGHHFLNSIDHFNFGSYPNNSPYLPLQQIVNVMDGNISSNVNQPRTTYSFDLDRIIIMNNNIAQCFNTQARPL